MLSALDKLFPTRYLVLGLCCFGLLLSVFSLLAFGAGGGLGPAQQGQGGGRGQR